MKKLLMMFTLIALFVAVCPVTANADTDISKQIAKLDGVKKAEVLQYGKICVVAVDTDNVNTKSQFVQLKSQIEELVKSKTDAQTVIVTSNVKVYREIVKINNMPQDKKQQYIEDLLDKLSRIPTPLPYFPTDRLPLPKTSTQP